MSTGAGLPSSDEARVIILGGGLAGLRCAGQLVREHGFSEDHVVLLEASAVIGGRIKTNTSFIEGFSVSSPAQHKHTVSGSSVGVRHQSCTELCINPLQSSLSASSQRPIERVDGSPDSVMLLMKRKLSVVYVQTAGDRIQP